MAAAGNGHTDLAQPTRSDATSPDYPPGTEVERVVTDDCLDLPSEGPHVIAVGSARAVDDQVRLLELRPGQHRRLGAGRLVP